MHILCTICSDLVNPAENIYVTKCGHIFHHHCLAQWIERSKSCPQCRNKVTEKCMFRLYPTISNESSGDDAATLQSRLDDAQLQLRQKNAACREKDDKLNELSTDLKRNEDLLKSYEKKLVSRDSAVQALKEQLDYLKIQNLETNKLKEENDQLHKNLQTLHGLQKVLNATAKEVENMLQGYTDVKTIALFATALKRALCESEAKKNESRDKLHAMKQHLGKEREIAAELQTQLMHLEEKLYNTERKYAALQNKRKACDISGKETHGGSSGKLRKSDTVDLNTAILGDSNSCNSSVNTLVKNIENADSPYLKLKQSCLAMSVMAGNVNGTAAGDCKRVPNNSPEKTYGAWETQGNTNNMKLAYCRAMQLRKGNCPSSIFYQKPPVTEDRLDLNVKASSLDLSYDGLGGHSKLDTFPKPQPKLKSSIPKLSAKHKLKRPSLPSGSQDIGKLLEKMNK